jgi:hypothetical protein
MSTKTAAKADGPRPDADQAAPPQPPADLPLGKPLLFLEGRSHNPYDPAWRQGDRVAIYLPVAAEAAAAPAGFARARVEAAVGRARAEAAESPAESRRLDYLERLKRARADATEADARAKHEAARAKDILKQGGDPSAAEAAAREARATAADMRSRAAALKGYVEEARAQGVLALYESLKAALDGLAAEARAERARALDEIRQALGPLAAKVLAAEHVAELAGAESRQAYADMSADLRAPRDEDDDD